MSESPPAAGTGEAAGPEARHDVTAALASLALVGITLPHRCNSTAYGADGGDT